MCSCLMWKKRVFEVSRVWPWEDLVGVPPYIVLIVQAFHNTTTTCLKKVGRGGYEWVEKEMWRFAEDMS